MVNESLDVSLNYQIPDELWEQIESLLPPPKPRKKLGRPRMNNRKAMTAIFYVLRFHCPWNALPRTLGASTTVFDRFQEWVQAGVFERMWRAGLCEYDERVGINWEGQILDRTIRRAPLGEKRKAVLTPPIEAHMVPSKTC